MEAHEELSEACGGNREAGQGGAVRRGWKCDQDFKAL